MSAVHYAPNTDQFTWTFLLIHQQPFGSLQTDRQTALFLLPSPRGSHFSVPRFVFIAVTVSQKKKKTSKRIKNLHPFSNVENVVQMFLIVIIKGKSGYVALSVDYYYCFLTSRRKF